MPRVHTIRLHGLPYASTDLFSVRARRAAYVQMRRTIAGVTRIGNAKELSRERSQGVVIPAGRASPQRPEAGEGALRVTRRTV